MRRLVVLSLAALLASCNGAGVSIAPSERPAPAPANTTKLLGTFDVTFTADAACVDLPPQARSRTYTATFRDDSSIVSLGGAEFVEAHAPYPEWNVVYTKFVGESAEIWFQDPPIWESLSDDGYLVIYGDAQGQIGPDTAKMPFWAKFEYCSEREPDDYPECEVPAKTCESANNELTLQRR